MAGVKCREEMRALGGRAQLGRALLSHSGEFHPGGKPCRVLFNISSDSLLTTAAFLILVLVIGSRVVSVHVPVP